MTEQSVLVHKVIEELRNVKEFVPTEDVDIVWAVSAPGTVKLAPNEGIYKGRSADLEAVNYAVEVVRRVTALRMGKDLSLVTKEDIEQYGPILYYNGENRSIPNFVFPQNEDFRELASDPSFPVPDSKVVISDIPEMGTHTQIKDIAKFLEDKKDVRKIAVVGLVHHSRRIARYLQKFKDLFPECVQLVSAPVPELHKPVGTTLREVRKIVRYAKKGDLNPDPYF